MNLIQLKQAIASLTLLVTSLSSQVAQLKSSDVVLGAPVVLPPERLETKFTESLTDFRDEKESTIPSGGKIREVVSKERPEIKLEKWNGEAGMTIRYDGVTSTGGLNRATQRFEWKDAKQEVHAYPIEAKAGMEDGGFEIEIILNEKPLTNIFEFQLEGHQDLDFFYQASLTQEHINSGMSRPENVVGSYAVYHKFLKNHQLGRTNYATGKAYHIFRPEVFDALETKVWGELNYSNGVLSITVPHSFLDTAVYPVRIDPTFGHTTAGGTLLANIAVTTNDDSRTQGTTYALSESANITKVSAALKSSADSQSLDLFYAVYREDSAGVDSHDLVASAEVLNQSINSSTVTFYDISFASESLTADDYVLAALGNAEDLSSGNISIYGDADSSNKFYSEGTTGVGSYATRKAENPWTEDDILSNFIQSIYVTYTVTTNWLDTTWLIR